MNELKKIMSECKTESGKDFRARVHKRSMKEIQKKKEYREKGYE